MRWAGDVACLDFARKARRKETTRATWEDNIKIYIREKGWGGLDWTDLAQDRDRWWALVNR
jgi:hypothetical protein